MKWSIITDSSCEYIGTSSHELAFAKVPFVINIGGVDHMDQTGMDVGEMVEAMEHASKAGHTACPAPGAWYEKFMKADQSIAITISAGVSGSYSSAMIAKKMALEQAPQKKIYVLDSVSAGSALSLMAEKAEEMIYEGQPFEKVVFALQEYANATKTIFALSSFGNLVKSGRLNRLTGLLAGKLGMWGLGTASEEGKIITTGKVRGPSKMMEAILEDMKSNQYRGGHVVITHCQNVSMAVRLKAKIRAKWTGARVTILPTGGLCSYYAERGGLIVGYER